MRRLALLCALSLVACGRNAAKDADEAHNLAEAVLAPEMPRGWHYSSDPDRIRNTVNRLAALPNEDEGTRDQTLILGIQQTGDGDVDIFFRGAGNNSVQCYTTCGIYYRAGDTTGSWIGERSGTDNSIVLSYPKEALPIIRSASTLIVEVQSDVGGQHTFKVAGLKWPPNT